MTKRKIIKRNPYQRLKNEVWNKYCTYYIRLRDAIAYSRRNGLSLDTGVCDCYTCGRVYNVETMHAGHWMSRGTGGSSGIYFDVRGIHTQCVRCNAFRQGMSREFRRHLIKEYGKDVVDELEIKHKINKYSRMGLEGLKIWFGCEIERMLKESGIEKWW